MSLIHADQLRQALIRQQHLLQLEEQRRAIEEPLMQQARDRLAAGWPLVDDDTEDTDDEDDEETDSQPADLTDPALLEAEQALRDWDREATTLRAPIPRRGPVEAAYAPSSPGLAPIPESPNERQSTVPASS